MGYFDSIYSDDNLPHRAKAVYMYPDEQPATVLAGDTADRR